MDPDRVAEIAAPGVARSREAPARRPVVPAIDGFRGLSALLVVLYHLYYGTGVPPLDEGPVRALILAGYQGIDFFFVISGFVLFLPVASSGGHLGSRRDYVLRRSARIVPAYYVALLFVIALNPLLTSMDVPLPHETLRGAASLLSHMAFLQHSVGFLLAPEGFGVLTIAWTLTLEVVFYVALPFVAARYYRHPFVGLVAAFIIAHAWKLFATDALSTLGWAGAGDWSAPSLYLVQLVLVTQAPTYVAHFAAGMTAAWLYARIVERVPLHARLRTALVVQVVSLVTLVLMMRSEAMRAFAGTPATAYDRWTRTSWIALAFTIVLLATALTYDWAQWPVANRVVRWLGDVSYGVYLWHLAAIGLAITTLNFSQSGTGADYLRMAAFVLPVSLLAGWLSWAFIEQPARRWAKRRSSPRCPASAALEDQQQAEPHQPPQDREQPVL